MGVSIDTATINGVRSASQHEYEQLGRITAQSFAEDPFNCWLFKNTEVMELLYSSLAQEVYLPGQLCYFATSQQAGADVGATMWMLSTDISDLSLATSIKIAWKVLISLGPGAVYKIFKFERESSKRKPAEPYMYLFSVGVLKDVRGIGLGRKLMVPMLDACDRERLPVFLESSNPENHGYYASLGFRTQEIYHFTKGAPPMEAMLRHPRPLKQECLSSRAAGLPEERP
ncbi:MAG: ribosomal protein S18 acetylase RimI-like enzyme [Halieaceae bacterium]|jgi:ribosomal protein S18 acetylase RimI-like enzyme